MTICNVGMIGAGTYFTGAHVPVGKVIEGLMEKDIIVQFSTIIVKG